MKPFEYIPNFIQSPNDWFKNLYYELDWEKRADAPRKEYWTNRYGRPYTYGKGKGERTYQSQPSHFIIELGRTYVYALKNVILEGCFLNLYDNCRDHLGWHADDDQNIDQTKPIAVITLGSARNIQFKNKETLQITTILLEPSSLLLMLPGCQSTHLHRIPKVGYDVGPRISMTYRGLFEEVK